MFKVKRSSGVDIINVQCTKIEDIPNELYESHDTLNLGINIDGDFIDVFDSNDNLIRRNMYINIYGAYRQNLHAQDIRRAIESVK